ncbi:uncharacterized protein LOC126812548 [Patella vulgata]|uniref:uncharacterized protein LOC126812548 n=1 Tax=Patella vulgata TaxID=6465 RepID=UPI0024A7C61F|nr:uncharacterized protein LOC126812548 [Patella vulgata]
MGDPIKIQVDLFDGYKKHITRGGDHIAVTQYTLCSLNPEIPGYKNMCNYTSANNYLPWYCD